jgi:hypothetical protein
VVVGSDRCGVAIWKGGLEFDSEGDLVSVHLRLSVWVGLVSRLHSPSRLRVTHSALRLGINPADKACFPQSFCMFFGAPTNATVCNNTHAKSPWPRARMRQENTPVGPVWATVPILKEGSLA